MRGIYFVDPEEDEFKESIKNERKNGSSDGGGCALQENKVKKNSSSPPQETERRGCKPDVIPKTKYACIVDVHESTIQLLESTLPKNHEGHIAGKGNTSMTHYNLVRKFIPVPQAMKIPDAEAAMDKNWKKLETILAWQLEKSTRHKETKKKVHFATLMDICHLKIAEFFPQISEVQRKSRAPR